MRSKRRPVHHGIAASAMLRGVAATPVAEAGNVDDEDLVRTEPMPVGAASGWSGDPLAVLVCAGSPGTAPSVDRPEVTGRFRSLDCQAVPIVPARTELISVRDSAGQQNTPGKVD